MSAGVSTEPSLPEGKRAVVMLNIAYEAWAVDAAPGLGPMGNPLPAGVHDTNAESFGAYGWKSGIWRLLRILERHSRQATVFASGRLAELNPGSLAAVVSGGHEVAPHGYTQDVIPATLDVDQERANITQTVDALASIVGREQLRGWLSPRCTPSAHTADLLVEAGLSWFSDVFDRDGPYLDERTRDLVWLPFTMDVNDLPVHLKHGHQPRQLLDTYLDTLAWIEREEGGVAHLDVTVHAHVFGRPHGAWVLDEICADLGRRPHIWTPTRREYAQWFLAHHSQPNDPRTTSTADGTSDDRRR
jgi:peptidoglycan/xylan/chitin deacetylase (PgdA/CDA1 family)